MMPYRNYCNMPIECAHCGNSRLSVKYDEMWSLYIYIWWENQYGSRIRIFCRKCQWATDRKNVSEKTTEMGSFFLDTIRPWKS